MVNIDKKIDDALGITQTITQELIHPKPIAKPLVPRPDDTLDHTDVDYKYSRENFYSLVERGQASVQEVWQ